MKTGVIAVLLTLGTIPNAEYAIGQQEDAYKVMPPPHYRTLVEMADCKTLSCLLTQRATLPNGEKMADLVFFSRKMELRPDTKAAEGLLQAIPASIAEETMFTNFPTWHDGTTETVRDMASFGRIYHRWPRLVARAALLKPDRMTNYVRYLRLAPNDMHGDFTGNAEIVCRKKHAEFVSAFEGLSEDDRAFIKKYVFDPTACKAIFLSEAE